MTKKNKEDTLDKRLRSTLGSAPEPDFNAWTERFSDSVGDLASHGPAVVQIPDRSARMTSARLLTWLAAAVLVVIGMHWMMVGSHDLSLKAFAASIPGVDNVQTLKWTTTTYTRFTSMDGKRTWIQKLRQLHEYRHPGQYRETRLDEHGDPGSISITDYHAGRTLFLEPKKKKATLKFPVKRRDSRGPFAWVGDMIRKRVSGEWQVTSVSLTGQREFEGVLANVVLVSCRSVKTPGTRRTEFLFDALSKQLIGILSPDADDLYDLGNQPEESWSKMQPIVGVLHEFVADVNRESVDFALDPPVGYTFEKIAKPTVTEDEMIAYLSATARLSAGRFPDSPYTAFDSEKFNAASDKDPADRTKSEQAMIEIRDKIMLREIYESPIKRFEEDQTAPGTFQYVGAGAKLGEIDKVVAWYRFRNETKFHVLYADLSVHDVDEKDLPLQLP